MKAAFAPAFTMPPMDQVVDLSVARMNETTLKPDTPVLCINRGNKVLTDKFDGVPLEEIPPGFFIIEYGPALHIQRRLIVPGTRTLDANGYVSYIGIVGTPDQRVKVDSEEMCQPFTTEELQAFGEKIEGLDRTALDGADRQVQAIRTNVARASSRSHGPMRPSLKVEGADAAEVFSKPEESATREAENEAAAEGVAAVRSRRR